MKMQEFVAKYCQDILDDYKNHTGDFSDVQDYDAIIEDEDGNHIKVIYIDGEPVDIEDMFSMDDEDFQGYHKNLPSAMEVRKKYLSRFKILLGVDVLLATLNDMKAEIAKTMRYSELYKEYINDQNTGDEEGSAVERELYLGKW